MRGVWVSRTAQWVARNRGKRVSDEQASIAYKLHLDPLPCWQHWSAERRQRQIAELLQQIEQEALERHERDETAPLGVAEILAQHPHAAPNRMKRAPAPLVHAASRKMRREFYRMYAAFVGAFYEAVERLKDGIHDPMFPNGAFPPPWSQAAPGQQSALSPLLTSNRSQPLARYAHRSIWLASSGLERAARRPSQYDAVAGCKTPRPLQQELRSLGHRLVHPTASASPPSMCGTITRRLEWALPELKGGRHFVSGPKLLRSPSRGRR